MIPVLIVGVLVLLVVLALGVCTARSGDREPKPPAPDDIAHVEGGRVR